MMGRVMSELSVEKLEKRVEGQVKMIDLVDESERPARVVRVKELNDDLTEIRGELATWQTVGWWVHGANTMLPKTGETTDLLIRVLKERVDLVLPDPGRNEEDVQMFGGNVGRAEYEEAVEGAYDESHSPAWVLGTSLLFEACVLGFGAFWFSRRDF
jgi:hypothetical protein